MFNGCITALVTPFKKQQLDLKKLKELIDFQISSGVNGLVLCGTTGESPTLSDDEKTAIYKTAVKYFRNKITLIAGTGTNDTAKSIKLTKMAEAIGLDGALIVTPYYNKPTQNGLYLHYKAIAAKTRLPIILYNVPGRTGVSIAPETVARLSEIKNIAAIKEASGSLEQVGQIKSLCNITILSGDDYMTFPILCLGGKGVISVSSNILPKNIVAMINAFEQGNIRLAKQYHYQLGPINKALFIESNPIPVKAAMKMLGRLNGEMRLPLTEMSKENQVKLKGVLQGYKF
ncbi:MAG: 4-hydroxy-tetrahydrodipicolinate synthase [Candidatus Brocadiia bacterium]